VRGLGADLEHGQVERAQVDLGDVGVPPGRLGRVHLLGRAGHGGRDQAVGGGPVVVQLLGPGIAAEVAQGGDQRLADRRVVGGQGAELAVIAAQVLQVGDQLGDVVHVGDDADQGADQAVALLGHRRREHVPRLGVAQEQVAVEVLRDHVRPVPRDLAEVRLESGRVDVRHYGFLTRSWWDGWLGPQAGSGAANSSQALLAASTITRSERNRKPRQDQSPPYADRVRAAAAMPEKLTRA
jgi:hypothetical protein